ncbi:lysozyme [Allokutzneria sp. NRRL B-24872]|uniref:lysozyme n=1 Tax=Allokutzneria sp. NRRL B-24872 TaxID=1137961 RepID=UPI00143CD899|nr:lysozyme [Allokutzneria sp. NRRL B-24872]
MAVSTRILLTAALLASATLSSPAALAEPVLGDTPMGSQIAKHEGVAEGTGRDFGPPVDPATGVAVPGIDVSRWQGDVDWHLHWNNGVRFAYVKATEGTGYVNPHFGQQYNGSFNVGMIRGSYHFALPDRSSGADQANYFVNNGGGWSRDGKTLPGALDIEYNPYSENKCYGLDQPTMTRWLKDFSDTYHHRTGRWPVIYTSTSWWAMCTGWHAGDFSNNNPLWVARYAAATGTLPHAWRVYTIWQYSSTPIDQNSFNGGYDRLIALAMG